MGINAVMTEQCFTYSSDHCMRSMARDMKCTVHAPEVSDGQVVRDMKCISHVLGVMGLSLIWVELGMSNTSV